MALVVVIGWLVPDRVALFLAGLVVLPYAVVLLARGARWPGAATLIAFAAACVLQTVSNRIADERLETLRAELLAHRASTGAYPSAYDGLERLGFDTRMGLPGALRHAHYFPPVGDDRRGPILFYAYAMPFGRRGIEVGTGHRFTLD